MIDLESNITFGRVKNETFVVNSKTGKALKFDSQGTQIWNLIYKGHSKEEIKEYFITQFPSYKSEVNKDIDNFFSLLQQEQII